MNPQLGRLPALLKASLFVAVCWAITPATGAWAQTDVWIDPGHGGGDNGNPGFDGIATHQEKFVCLLQSQSLNSRLAQIGYTSLLTRNSDNNYPSLEQRALMAIGQLANDLGEQEDGQMFVSIHMNSPKAATNAAPFGTETYYSPVKVFAHRLDTYKVDSAFAARHPHGPDDRCRRCVPWLQSGSWGQVRPASGHPRGESPGGPHRGVLPHQPVPADQHPAGRRPGADLEWDRVGDQQSYRSRRGSSLSP